MRDALELEAKGIPTVVIVAEALIGSAEAVKRMMGNPDYAYCVLTEPSRGLSDDETAARARELAPKVAALLTGQNTGKTA